MILTMEADAPSEDIFRVVVVQVGSVAFGSSEPLVAGRCSVDSGSQIVHGPDGRSAAHAGAASYSVK